VEKDLRVAAIWKWLIHEASSKDIKDLPDLKVGDKSSDFLQIVHAATKMAFQYKTIKVTPVLARNWEISKRYMELNVYKVKHWQIIEDDYSKSPDLEATWFIDPPYKKDSGRGYRHSSYLIDYGQLAEWAKDRKGEIIFCEGEHGDYLPFRPLLDSKGVAGKSSKELIYYHSLKPSVQFELFVSSQALSHPSFSASLHSCYFRVPSGCSTDCTPIIRE
jgi:hypothetical protein